MSSYYARLSRVIEGSFGSVFRAQFLRVHG